ncbi:hypothetical protein LCGC14_1510040 [marine sediment metagenome]|uniref:IstB-like ATP-binding domain-containing protein n=1 Tax=marine sediment metagenome TaxID=412755 RepID=A0A0F9LH30_9ZZZZ
MLEQIGNPSPEANARADRQREDDRRRVEALNRKDCIKTLDQDLGNRFRRCSLTNYEIYNPAQRDVVDRLKVLQNDVVEHVQAGRGLFLYGNCGTGKDHLAVAILRKAAWEGLSARCINGIKLFGDVADAWRGEGSEGDVIGPLLRPDVLLISDPVLPSGITESNQRTLYRLIARRYDRRLSTWCTTNVAGSKGAIELLGNQVYSRLIDDAIRLHCSWECYRERRRIT